MIKERHPMQKCISYVSLVAEASNNQLLSPKEVYWQDLENLLSSKKGQRCGLDRGRVLAWVRGAEPPPLDRITEENEFQPGGGLFIAQLENLNSRGEDSHSSAEGGQNSQINSLTDGIQ